MKTVTEKDIKAAWGNPAAIRPRRNCEGIILGCTDSSGELCVDYKPALTDIRADENLFITGEGGAAESCDAAVPYCRQAIRRGHSIVITDIRDELYLSLSEEFRNEGYVVKRLDFSDPENSDPWDLFGSLRDIDFDKDGLKAVTEVLRLSGNLLSQTEPDAGRSAASAAAYSLLCMHIRKLFADVSVKEEDKNAKTLMERIEHPDSEDLSVFNEQVLINARAILLDRLSALADSRVVEMVSERGIDTFLPNVRKCAYFVSLPDTVGKNCVYSQSLIAAFINNVVYLHEIAERSRRVQIDFLLRDLGFWQCRIPRLESTLASAKYNKMSFCLIDRFDNLKKLYCGKAYEILRRCSIWQVLGTGIPDDMLGFLTVIGKADEFSGELRCSRPDSETALVSVCGSKPIVLYKNRER